MSCTYCKASNEEVITFTSIFRLEVIQMGKTVHNNTQKQ